MAVESESFETAVEFPGGRVENPVEIPMDQLGKAAEARLGDARFVLDEPGRRGWNLGEVAERGLDRPVFLYGRQEVKPGTTVEHAGSKMYATASRRRTLLFPAFGTSTEDGRGAGNGSRMTGPISCAKYGLEVPVGGGGPTLMITGLTREPAA
ncbi:hypothetical protein ABT120_19345 [Nonomuraea angiospora]|uniref:hypothetical protein n=1 Tax=Nonomuraea angiospora TaxID=46172 RepID=UPI003333A5CB